MPYGKPFRVDFTPQGMLPYPSRPKAQCRSFGVGLEPRYIFGARQLDQ